MQIKEKGAWFMGRRFVGEVNGLFIEVQVFDEPSKYGIGEGRISRLAIYPDQQPGHFGRRLAHYERGWDEFPRKSDVRTVVEEMVRHFDHKRLDWAFEERRYQERLE